ncbi:MAG: 7-carboxy-7-deazaguanine synthase QueE [Candidatus Omnitrophota bacterium]
MNIKAIGKITEVFTSIQGEGLYFGEEQIFVRFFGCNLKCRFCDTHLDRFTEYKPEELVQELSLYKNGRSTISFTGGEPLMQKYFLRAVLKLTKKEGYKNYLETNGILHGALEDVIDCVDVVAMDLKFPSSTGLNDFWHQHRRFLGIASKKETFIKAVICRDTSEQDLKEAIKLIKDADRFLVLVLQPNSYEESDLMREKLERFKEIARENNITACIIPQLHKKTGLR